MVATGHRLAAFELHVRAGRLIRRAWASVRTAVTALAAPPPGDQELLEEVLRGRAPGPLGPSSCMFIAGNNEDSAVLYEYWPDVTPPMLEARALLLAAYVFLDIVMQQHATHSGIASALGYRILGLYEKCACTRVRVSCSVLIACLMAHKHSPEMSGEPSGAQTARIALCWCNQALQEAKPRPSWRGCMHACPIYSPILLKKMCTSIMTLPLPEIGMRGAGGERRPALPPGGSVPAAPVE